MKNENYINIQGWMMNELDLKGNELILYALIYGFSQDGESEFHGSIRYIMDLLMLSNPTVQKLLKSLVYKKVIHKTSESHYKVYKKVIQCVQETYTPSVQESYTNNNNTNNNTSYKAEKNFDSNLVSASERFSGTKELQGTQPKEEVLEPLIEKLNLKRGDEYEPDNLSPLDRNLIKRQTEKILGLRRATKWQKDIYGIGSDYLAAYNNTTKADYIGTVILDDVAKNIATYLELGETRQTLRDMMIAFFNSEKAKDITITPRTVFSTHTYNSWKQSKL